MFIQPQLTIVGIDAGTVNTSTDLRRITGTDDETRGGARPRVLLQ